MRQLLTCVYQATENSSAITQQAAATLTSSLGANYLELNINALVKGYVDIVSEALQRKLTWEKDDIALQNIQARTRSPGVWLLANLQNALLLATSNRSEAALGYATMDGDTSGSISPLAGIDKEFIRHWLQWLEQQGPIQLAPFSALSLVNQQQPTAELRPSEMSQTDEQDLMPYPLLNTVEKAAIRDRQTPYEILHLLQNRYPEYTSEQLLIWIERFFNLWTRNQWKRERYAPSFHLDDESLDPKTWCRFPILSGGFASELAEMRLRFKQE
jgi:NAD+ synthase (glutamine-hydrolysing)